MRERYQFLSKDFIETREGLVFAVVVSGIEQGRVLGFARYRRFANGFQKLSTQPARDRLVEEFPAYFFRCPMRDVELPGIPLDSIVCHYLPGEGLQKSQDPVVRQASDIFEALGNSLGVTGSHLLGANTHGSDIDLVVYGLENFNKARQLLEEAIAYGGAQALSNWQWRETFRRRGATALNFRQYQWHELRKHNKFSVGGVKVDLSCVAEPHPCTRVAGTKRGAGRIQARIACDEYGFASPAVYEIEHASVSAIIVNSATYVGQAKRGETVEACGMIEETDLGTQRMIIGSSRECPGEHLKVVRSPGS